MKWNENWQSILRIAKIELNTMFYSPVAWLILVVFAFQTGLAYSGLLNDLIHRQAMGESMLGITGKIFGMESFSGVMSENNFFSYIANYLYLYIPLMTMGLLSKEYSSGSVKLLFSVPVTNRSIVLGKFGAMLVYGGILMVIIIGYVIYSGCVIENFDWGHAWCGVLGIFLLICTYAAIGLFMSSITVYPVVAAMGTLALLAVLNYIGEVGQDIGFVRDITYWLALSGKTKDFILGMVPSESIIYFLSLICFFLYITLLRLEDLRTRRSRKLMILRYVVAVAMLVGVSWFSSRAFCKFYCDLTAIHSNTLSRESQEVVKRADGPLKITTYVNMLDVYVWNEVLPGRIKEDMKRFERYSRFKPEIEMEYVYYWDEANNTALQEKYPELTNRERAELICRANKMDFESVLTPEQIKERRDLSAFGNHVVRLFERGSGEHDFLPIYQEHDMHPQEPELTAVFKHLTGEKSKVVFVEKHSDRSIMNPNERGYWWKTSNFFYRSSLKSMGFDVSPLDLRQEEIVDGTDILVVSSLKTPLSDLEKQKVENYIAGGGNLIILAEAGFQQHTNSIVESLGLHFTDEIAVCNSQNPSVIMADISEQALPLIPGLPRVVGEQTIIVQKDVPAINYSGVKDFNIIPLVVSKPHGVWLEKEVQNIGDDTIMLNPLAGEKEDVYHFMLAMERQVAGKSQRILVASDPCWFNNEHSRWMTGTRYANYRLFPVLMRWLSEGKFPVAAVRDLPADNQIYLKSGARTWNTWMMAVLIPGLILAFGLVVIKKRKRI